MPSDEYTAIGGGALRIKGAKVKKHKTKKKNKEAAKSDLEKNLSTGGGDDGPAGRASSKEPRQEGEEEQGQQQKEEEEATTTTTTTSHKTEAERRFEEARKKKLLQLSEQAGSRPELLKTHKERVEELNTYLSKLSEHHDMPKIGPG